MLYRQASRELVPNLLLPRPLPLPLPLPGTRPPAPATDTAPAQRHGLATRRRSSVILPTARSTPLSTPWPLSAIPTAALCLLPPLRRGHVRHL